MKLFFSYGSIFYCCLPDSILYLVLLYHLFNFTYLYNRLDIGIIFKVIDNCIPVLCYRFIIFSNIINVKITYS